MKLSTTSRRFDCFSCMSLSYQESWEYLQNIYTAPKVFTNRCNDPFLSKNIPTTHCSSICISLLEPDVEAGVFIGYKYIRGCLDRVLRNGFNETALRTHRFHQTDQCRSLPRSQLYNPSRESHHPIFGDVQLCTCFGDRCNAASFAQSLSTYISIFPILLNLFFVVFRIDQQMLRIEIR
ncbi:unnamed protein product [Dracunculus medinensis]|uniref:Protein quiver n=1 Tax=Dracunculus medinensis TaxID=318479 RepID=A0A3P7SI76_DRAME|nr:unnamed protein product [Dracunculus medinensis]